MIQFFEKLSVSQFNGIILTSIFGEKKILHNMWVKQIVAW